MWQLQTGPRHLTHLHQVIKTELEKVPTFDRLRTAFMASYVTNDIENQQSDDKNLHKQVDVDNLSVNDHQQIIDRLFKVAEVDNEIFLKKLRDRFDRVGINLPTIEVRFENLAVKTECYVGNRAIPTLTNTIRNNADMAFGFLGIGLSKTRKLTILDNVSGIVKPSRMTLLLGPPSSGKTTLLQALAGRSHPGLTVEGKVTYNGHTLDKFVPQRTASYVSQSDVHVGEMTVKETLDFSARCQGARSQYELLTELDKREKEAGTCPEPEIDPFLKATAMEGVENSLITDYIIKILGLEICRDTVVGNQMIRGISGGQKKRLTTGEMIVGPTKALFMDEISSGLDTSTTFQIVKCLQDITHLTRATVFMSLLQPSPETFNLFDDIILLSQGQIIYQGPREHITEFFESLGFTCPERKGIADFLQEVISRKDQEQYWADKSKSYTYVSVSQFKDHFERFHVGHELQKELLVPYNKNESNKSALVFKNYLVLKKDLFKASFDKEVLLIKRTAVVYIAKTLQISFVAIIGATMFLRTRMHSRNEDDGALYVGALLFVLIINMFNGFPELPMTIERLPVLYKHRDLRFHPTWAYTVPTILLRVPISLIESTVWTILTYYVIGFAPEASRFFKYFLVTFLIQQMASGIFRLVAAVCRTMTIANTAGTLFLESTFLLGGIILPKDRIPDWWQWAYWVSPLSYGFNALTTNELFAPRWMNEVGSDNVTRLGVAVLHNFGVTPNRNGFWIGAAALLGLAVLFNVLFTLALTYLDAPGKPQATILDDAAKQMDVDYKNQNINEDLSVEAENVAAPRRGMVLPFTLLSMSFDNVNYYVDMPPAMKEQGVKDEKLQLLKEVKGAFRPGILTALMGISGAGKTTLMDVLSGRKTGGYVEGDIRISGFPKVQETFTRISGYCEQNDIHSPQVTVYESLIFSAFLRLPKDINKQEKMLFVEEVMELVELDNLKDMIVGIPGVTGLSTQQRKRLTIAVELVANPSIIFMDEPTTGLDARAAAIVMRTVRNTVDTGRTVVCTIHQPGVDIFEAFDELLLMKTGGEVIYSGPLGLNSEKLVDYLEAIPGVPRILDGQNPATWMLEVTSVAAELKLGIDFAQYYKSSSLYQRNSDLVKELSIPPSGAKQLIFATHYPESTWGQFMSCLKKQWMSYWRTPDYNLVRFSFTLVTALLIGSIFWKVGTKRDSSTDLTMIFGGLYGAVLFAGINNGNTVVPIAAFERTVFYRERAAGMYSTLPYAMAQVIVEIPYVLFQTTYYTLIVYTMVSFEWTVPKYLWFFFIHLLTFLYFTYHGLMSVSLTPNDQLASILTSAFYSLFNLFSGFFIPRPKIPKWWVWCYWICPLAWTFQGLIASQYGDVNDTIKVPGMLRDPTIKWYVENHFGYQERYLGVVAIVLVSFTVFFTVMYAYCLNKLNFQTR
ncbi:ABC transporter G family member 29-like [Rutidosis leptorrhynchoides]|uniref:ABC transporter G family member 29-like n=1 Tax=Rutidosis leptorrhynchoides TaxID=125765 RepID=UPI003A9A617B